MKVETPQYEQLKGLESLLASHDHIYAQMRATKCHQIETHSKFIDMEKESLMSCRALDQCSMNWCHDQYSDFEPLNNLFEIAIRNNG